MGRRIKYEYDREGIKQSVLRCAKGARMPDGWAESVAERAAQATDKWIADKGTVTEEDLRKVIYEELEDIAPDIAFAYRNHGKII